MELRWLLKRWPWCCKYGGENLGATTIWCLGLFIAPTCVKSQNQLSFHTMKTWGQPLSGAMFCIHPKCPWALAGQLRATADKFNGMELRWSKRWPWCCKYGGENHYLVPCLVSTRNALEQATATGYCWSVQCPAVALWVLMSVLMSRAVCPTVNTSESEKEPLGLSFLN